METLHLPTSLIISRNLSLNRTRRIKLKVNQNFGNRHTSLSSLLSTPQFPVIKCSTHHHEHHDHDHHHHNHNHHHGPSNDGSVRLTKFQEKFLSFAKTVKWTHLANFLREHLELCCCSAALFLAVAACPYLIPKPAVKPLQQAFTLIAFPLVGVIITLIS